MNKTYIIVALLAIIILAIYLLIKKNIYLSGEKINVLFTKFTNNPAVLDPNDYSWSQAFRDNWEIIRDEYINYKGTIPVHNQVNATVSEIDSGNKWKTLYLRAYGKDTTITKYFPQTLSLINKAPCTLAFFSVMEPHSKLDPHIGIYKGVLRYHLGLIIPDLWKECFINLNGRVLNWQAGKDIMFDDMFEHYVENRTDQQRVILFLDIKRDFHNPILNAINNIFLRLVKSNDAVKDTIDNANSFDRTF